MNHPPNRRPSAGVVAVLLTCLTLAIVASSCVSPKAPVTEQILNHARWMGADLIVAGGYGHSRIGERILGGVTHKLLHQTERFVLFSH